MNKSKESDNASNSEELTFWDQELSLTGEYSDQIKKSMDPDLWHEAYPFSLINPLLPLMEKEFPEEAPFRFIEIGSGPLSTLAYGAGKGIIKVEAVDVLADQYHMLYRKHGISDYPIKPVQGSGETLHELYPKESFHCAYVRNALDHTQDIMLSFRNIVSAVKANGFIILSHFVREGSNENWSDAHKWDLELTSNGFMAFDSRGEEYHLQKNNNVEFVHVYYDSIYLNRWMNVIFKKTG
jgi:hypothetical protein